jgi:hypothetical protein
MWLRVRVQKVRARHRATHLILRYLEHKMWLKNAPFWRENGGVGLSEYVKLLPKPPEPLHRKLQLTCDIVKRDKQIFCAEMQWRKLPASSLVPNSLTYSSSSLNTSNHQRMEYLHRRFTHHKSHVTRHTSHVTRHTSQVEPIAPIAKPGDEFIPRIPAARIHERAACR